MRPSEIASVLGLDQQDRVTAVPFDEKPIARAPGTRAQRRRKHKKPQVRNVHRKGV